MFTTGPYNIFDTHANQGVGHANLLQDVAVNVDSFMTDIRQLGKSDNVTLFFYSELGDEPWTMAPAPTTAPAEWLSP
ncbi:MAG: hypothetical protein CM1200mP27_10200 [Chloroflexota bacterium]|nr:MAG: hypothetical protein CM1200mP27_10200 [Chloroflexota bacterium]